MNTLYVSTPFVIFENPNIAEPNGFEFSRIQPIIKVPVEPSHTMLIFTRFNWSFYEG